MSSYRYSRPSRSRRIQRCSGRARRPLSRPQPSAKRQLQPDRPVVGWAEGQRIGRAAGEPVRQAAVEPERHDVAGIVRRLARADVVEARQDDRPHDIEVADDGRRLAAQRRGNARELAAVQELAVAADARWRRSSRPPARSARAVAAGARATARPAATARAARRSDAGSTPPGHGCGRATTGDGSVRRSPTAAPPSPASLPASAARRASRAAPGWRHHRLPRR